MTILSALPILMLAIVAIWFFWPMVSDPILRLKAQRSKDEADRVAEHLFDAWSKYGQATSLLIRSDRG